MARFFGMAWQRTFESFDINKIKDMDLTMKQPSTKMVVSTKFKGTKIENPLQAYYIFLDNISDDSETPGKEYHAILLDNDYKINCEVSFLPKNGDQRKKFEEVLQLAKKKKLSKVFLAESSFSKNILPSARQADLAKQFKELARELNVSLIDQIILSERSYFSYGENGI